MLKKAGYTENVEAEDGEQGLEKVKTEKDRLEKAFIRDVKGRILETSKYIRPNEKTLDFAFMFIPSEAII